MREEVALQERETAQEAAASTTYVRRPTPPKPTRQAPIPQSQRQGQIPATPNQLPEVPGLSPRLRLKAENFKNTAGEKEDIYYAKKIFDEIRQRGYISQHPTSQYDN
eukprot:6164022-Amphidinium_carterae.1